VKTSGKQEHSPADAAVSAIDVGVKVVEIAIASSVVIGARMMLIGAAMRNPLSGDYGELGRMLPEKLFAVAQSGIAFIDQVGAAQRDMNAQMIESRLLMAGGVRTPASLLKMANDAGRRGTRAMLWPFTTGGATLAPVHRAVTSNAKRLRGRGGIH